MFVLNIRKPFRDNGYKLVWCSLHAAVGVGCWGQLASTSRTQSPMEAFSFLERKNFCEIWRLCLILMKK